MNFSLIFNRIVQVIRLNYLALITDRAGMNYVIQLWLSFIFCRRSITYLGRVFYYEDRLNPFTLFNYINEISEMTSICNFVGGRVLDIGANVGIYGYTLVRMFDNVQVYSFEPNPIPFKILSRNAKPESRWHVFNVGISDTDASQELFFVKNKTGQGSVYRNNATLDLLFEGDLQSTTVTCSPLTGRLLNQCDGFYFDLVKIDVEGYESIVIKGMKDVVWSSMYVEFSLAREGAISFDDFVNLVKSIWPAARLIKYIKRGNTADVYFRNAAYCATHLDEQLVGHLSGSSL